jgi:hypothetical protein
VAKEIEKVACQFCGKEIAKVGIKNHEKSCPENPANKVPAEGEQSPEEVLNVSGEGAGAPEEGAGEAPSTVTVVAEDEVREKEVEVLMNESIECYIGNKYWRLKAGEKYPVPESVKEILKNAGMLKAL